MINKNISLLVIVFVNEDKNTEAAEAMRMAIDHINMNPQMALQIQVEHIEENENSTLIFPDICKIN